MVQRVTVVGAGVVGLCCAIRLAEHGFEVDVLARDLPPETTSAAAGGLWLPHLVAPAERVARWAAAGLRELQALAADDGSGIRLAPGHLLHRRPAPRPDWADAVAELAPLDPVGDPAPGFGFGFRATLPLADITVYLTYLAGRLKAAGGTLTRLPLPALPARGLVLNCTGLSARALVPDPSVRPIRGQVVLVDNPGLTHWWVYEGGPGDPPCYVLPRGEVAVLGGTSEDGAWSTAPDPSTAQRLLSRARELVPELRESRVVGHRVGLRPFRPEVRLAVERVPTGEDPEHTLVHCYGHGGSGFTLSWGCADEVLDEVLALAG